MTVCGTSHQRISCSMTPRRSMEIQPIDHLSHRVRKNYKKKSRSTSESIKHNTTLRDDRRKFRYFSGTNTAPFSQRCMGAGLNHQDSGKQVTRFAVESAPAPRGTFESFHQDSGKQVTRFAMESAPAPRGT